MALGSEGQGFVEALSQSLNCVDIAASSDRTGPLDLGGDWDLEYTYGEIETVLPFTVQGMNGIDHCLNCSSSCAPTFSNLNGGSTYTENGSPVAIDSDVTVADTELDALNGGNGNYSGASLTIARNGGASASDSFDFNTTGASFTVSGGNLQFGGQTFATFTNAGGTLTINFTSSATTATSTLADEVLQRITYSNSSDTPPASVTLNWSFSDGTDSGNGQSTVAITAVNDAPTLTSTGGNPTYLPGGPASTLFSGTSISTIEAGQNITGMTLTVTNVTDGASEGLLIDGTTVALTNGTSGTSASNSFVYSVLLAGTTATVTLTKTNDTAANWQTLVDGLKYQDTSSNPTTGSNRVVTITSVKDSGGTANGGVDTASLSVASTVSFGLPSITSATYDWSNGQMVLTGTNFVAATGAGNDVIANLLKIFGEGGASYTLTDTANVEITSSTSATLTLSATDKLNVHGLLNKNGANSGMGTAYSIEASDNWLAGSPSGLNIADTTGNGITVSNVQTPTITSATYDSDTGILVVTGTNLFKKAGVSNDIDLSMLTFTGDGGRTYTLSTPNVEITSETSFTATLTGADKTNVDALLDKVGTRSSDNTTYNLAAADDWLTAADSTLNIIDT